MAEEKVQKCCPAIIIFMDNKYGDDATPEEVLERFAHEEGTMTCLATIEKMFGIHPMIVVVNDDSAGVKGTTILTSGMSIEYNNE